MDLENERRKLLRFMHCVYKRLFSSFVNIAYERIVSINYVADSNKSHEIKLRLPGLNIKFNYGYIPTTDGTVLNVERCCVLWLVCKILS